MRDLLRWEYFGGAAVGIRVHAGGDRFTSRAEPHRVVVGHLNLGDAPMRLRHPVKRELGSPGIELDDRAVSLARHPNYCPICPVRCRRDLRRSAEFRIQ